MLGLRFFYTSVLKTLNKTCNDRPLKNVGWTAKSAASQQRGPFTLRYEYYGRALIKIH